jgi:hypothetical protein
VVLDHLTRWYFLFTPPPCKKNLFLVLSILFRIFLGVDALTYSMLEYYWGTNLWELISLQRIEHFLSIHPFFLSVFHLVEASQQHAIYYWSRAHPNIWLFILQWHSLRYHYEAHRSKYVRR